MRKNIREFQRGDLIRLFACGWQSVEGEPLTNTDEGYTMLPVTIQGMRYMQLLKFDWREEYECKPPGAEERR